MGNKKLLKEDLSRFNQIMGYNPSKGLIKEEALLTEGLFDFFREFGKNKEEIKENLSNDLGVEEGDTKEEITDKLKDKLGEGVDETKLEIFIKKTFNNMLGRFLLRALSIYLLYKAGVASPLGNQGDIIAFLGYAIAYFLSWNLLDNISNKNR
jgi:hypothetical protein